MQRALHDLPPSRADLLPMLAMGLFSGALLLGLTWFCRASWRAGRSLRRGEENERELARFCALLLLLNPPMGPVLTWAVLRQLRRLDQDEAPDTPMPPEVELFAGAFVVTGLGLGPIFCSPFVLLLLLAFAVMGF
ncbi:MAG: hypothetical protein H6741_09760 [Alphaproteobacteria bacterium]|nr:hypothetical protein [Alphaproteobacteria bacterium]MCB9792997.1 hypothetical protein [Alphaproteobacteria bacterium]